jgi:Uma2 family endonuclease
MTLAVEAETFPQHVVLWDVSWELYQKLLRETREQNLRFTYDDGVLEIMSPLPEHEQIKTTIGGFIEILALELDVAMAPLGSTTFARKSIRKGLEPDECYYIQNEAKIRGKKRLNLRRDPPPDLVIEVDVSYRTIDKRALYRAMRVPEIWSCHDGKIECLHLKRGRYVPSETSLAFPFLKPAEMERFLKMYGTTDDTSIRRAWRDWVRRKYVA